jgi:hypothetical protein
MFETTWDDRRTPEQLKADGAATRGQLGVIRRLGRDARARREALESVARARNADPGGTPVEVVDIGAGDAALVVRGELLVATAGQADWLRDELARGGFEPVDVPVPDGADVKDLGFQRYRNPALPGKALLALAARLRRRDQPVTAHFLAACQPTPPRSPRLDGDQQQVVAKGTGSPEPAGFGLPAPVPPQPAAVTVAVLDTGIAAPRKDGWLSEVARSGTNSDRLDADADGWLDAAAGHGTFVAGIVRQVAPEAGIECHAPCAPDGFALEADLASALAVAGSRADVLNLSLGTHTDLDQPLLAVEAVLDALAAAGHEPVLVAAAGNWGGTRPVWPAASPRVLAVAALRADLHPAGWSGHGPWVDASSVGEGVLSTFVEGSAHAPDGTVVSFPPDPWSVWTGTSFSAPQVAGAIAQLAVSSGMKARDAAADLLGAAPSQPGYGRLVPRLPGTAS